MGIKEIESKDENFFLKNDFKDIESQDNEIYIIIDNIKEYWKLLSEANKKKYGII